MKHKGRIEETIRQIVAALLVRRVKDPRVSNVSITRVEVSSDYSVAKIMYNVIGNADDLAEVQQGLESCKGFIRGHVKKHIRLHVIPELVFKYDESLDRAMEIETLLDRIHDEEGERNGGEEDDPRDISE